MIKEIIGHICENKDSDFFTYYIDFMQYQELKQCKEKLIEIVSHIIGTFKYSINYNNKKELFELRICKCSESEI